MLDRSTLASELAHFADPSDGGFSGWSRDRVTARHAWSHAFATYVAAMESTTLAPTNTSIDFSHVEDAFFSALTLANPTVAAAASDFSNAWAAAIAALAAGASATAGGSTSFTFAAMDPSDVSTRQSALTSALASAFATGSPTRQADLGEIASALHDATTGIRSTPTPVVVVYT